MPVKFRIIPADMAPGDPKGPSKSMINWRVAHRPTNNPVEIMEGNKVVLRVYDWEGSEIDADKLHEGEYGPTRNAIRRKRLLNNLKKAGMIILAVKMLEVN